MSDRELLEQILTNQISMQNQMNSLQSDVTDLKSDVKSLKSDVKSLQCITTSLDNRMAVMEKELEKTKEKVTDIQVYLENRLEKNIRIIAEGHIGLTKKIDHMSRQMNDMESRQELLAVLVNEHEHKLRKIV